MPEKLKILHENLTKKVDGFNVPYEQFEIDMQDDEKLKKLHSNLSDIQEGFNVPYEQFKADMQVKKKETGETSSEDLPPVSQEGEPASLSELLKEEGEPTEIEVPLEDLQKPERKEVVGEATEFKPEPIRERTKKEQEILNKAIDFQTESFSNPNEKQIMALAIKNVEDKLFAYSEKEKKGEVLGSKRKYEPYFGASVLGSVPTRVSSYYDAVSELTGDEVTLENLKEIGLENGLDIKDDGSPNMEIYSNQMQDYSEAISKEYLRLKGEVSEKDPFLNDMADALAEGIANMSKNVTALAGYAGFNAIPGYYENVVETYDYLQDEYEDQVSRKDRSITDAVNNKEYGKAVGNTVLGITESAPMLATMALGNAAGYGDAILAFLAAEEGAGRYYELEDADMSEIAKILDASMWGMSEAVFEKVGTFSTMQAVKQSLKKGVQKEVAEDIVKRSFQHELIRGTEGVLKYANRAGRGGLEEVATTMTQNTLEGNDLMQGVGDSFIVGFMTDAVISSPEIAIDSKEAAREVAIQIKNAIPKNMPLENKVKAAELILEKKKTQKVESEMDDAFKGSQKDKVDDIDQAIKLTTLNKDDQYVANEVNKKLNEELEKENPDIEKLVYLNNFLSSKEGKAGAVIDKQSQDVIDEAVKANTPEEVVSAVTSIQKKRTESYDKAFGNLDSEFNSNVNKESKSKGEEAAVEVEKSYKTEQISEEKPQVEQEPIKEDKVAKKEAETPKKEITEPKIETDEKVVQKRDVKKEDVREEVAEEEGRKDRQEEVLGEFQTVNKTDYLKSDNVYLRVDKNETTGEVVQGVTSEQWSDPAYLQTKVDDIKKEKQGLKDAKMDTTPETEAISLLENRIKQIKDAKELEGGKMRIEGKPTKEQKVSDKDMPEIDRTELQNRAKVEIEKKIGKIEELNQKRKEAVQKGLDSLGRLGNIKFALDEGGKKQAIQDIVTAVKSFTEAGVISAEIGTLKAIDFIKSQLKDPKAQKFIDDNKAEIQKLLEKEVDTVLEESKKREEKKKVTTESKTKERRLGKKALENTTLPEGFRNDLADRGIEYAVRGKKVTEKEADEIADVYIKEDRADELKSVILDTTNDIAADTRTTLAVKYAKRSLVESSKATNEADRKAYKDDALDVFYMDMQQSTQQAQALQSKAKWSEVVATEPDLFVEYAKKEQRKQNDKRLESRKEDVKTSQQVIEDFLKSKEFKKEVEKRAEEKAVSKYDALLEKGKASKEKRERGKAKFADGLNKVIEAIGAKKNAVAENEIKPDWLEGIKEMADGLLDIGVSSVDQLMTKIKVALREYVSPIEVDKYKDEILKDTEAKRRVRKPVQKKDVLSEKELNELVDKLYEKMVGGTKAQARALARNYLDRLAEGGALDEQSFKDIFAASIGLEHLRPEDEVKLREMAERLSDLRAIKNNLEDLFKRFVVLDVSIAKAKSEGKMTPEMQKEYDKLRKEINTQTEAYNQSLDEAKKANKGISEYFADPRTTFDLMSTFIQGNLLTPISLITNITANTMWLPFRGVKYAIANALDMALYGVGAVKESLLEKYSDNPKVRRMLMSKWLPDKKRTYDMMGYARGYIPGFKEGFFEGLRQMRTGQLPEDAYIREIGRSLHPLKSAINVVAAMSGKEKARASKVLNDSMEALFGAPPEIMFRLLNLGDKPFRRAAERARLEEIATLKGLEGAQKEAFKMFPDDATLEDMRQAGLEATYQQDSKISNFLLGKGKSKKDALNKIDIRRNNVFKFLFKTQIPYVKTPTNILIETLDYAIPLVSGYKALEYAIKGDRRKSLDYMSRAVTGLMIDSALTSMFVAGLFTFAPQGLEEEDRDKKVRESEFASGKLPYYMNLDAVNRWLAGENTEWQDGDDLISIKRFGIISALMMGKMESFRGKTPGEVADMTYMDSKIGASMSTLKSSLDQSFVSGLNNMINAFFGSEYEKINWFVGTSKAISAGVLPNTYAALNKYRDGYIRETKNSFIENNMDRVMADIRDDFKASYLNADDVPSKVSIWGERVTRVPDGRGLGFMLFDVSQSREYNSMFGMEIQELYERTRDKSVIPSQPGKVYRYDGVDVRLTNKMYEDLQIRLNSINKQVIEPLVESQSWDSWDDDMKILKINQYQKKIESKKKKQKKYFEGEWEYELKELAEKQKK